MIVFDSTKSGEAIAARFLSALPGAEGTRDLMQFCATLRLDWSRVAGKGTSDEAILLRGRSISRGRDYGAQEIAASDVGEIMEYKRYLTASTDRDRVDRRLAARLALALSMDFGYEDDRVATAVASSYGLTEEQTLAEIEVAMREAPHVAGGYASWRDDPGSPERCSRCRRHVRDGLDSEPIALEWQPALLTPDIDGFYRCGECAAAVRQPAGGWNLLQALARGDFRRAN